MGTCATGGCLRRPGRGPISKFQNSNTEKPQLPFNRLAHRNPDTPWRNIFLIVDTYSQTSADDTKGTVSRYIKTLRDLQDKASAVGATITIMVIDHTTKSGDTYMGSLSKEGDTDVMIEVHRHGNAATIKCAKMKTAVPFKPMHFDLRPFTLEGYQDALGRPLTSLIVVDGEHAHQVRKVAGADKDTAAAVLLSIANQTGDTNKDSLRQLYSVHPSNDGKKAESVSRTFLRAFDLLVNTKAILVNSEGLITCSDVSKNS